MSAFSVVLVIWLVAAATGPDAYAAVQRWIGSWFGKILMLGCTFSFFMHLFGGIRHLAWDAGYGFELRTIYASGWTVVVVSVVLTAVTWVASIVVGS